MQSTFKRAPRASYFATVAAAVLACVAGSNPAEAASRVVNFEMVRSPALAAYPYCLPYAHGSVHIESKGAVEVMTVSLDGMPYNTDFVLFNIQQPNPPFGLGWYQADLLTDGTGHASQKVIGRFNKETFIVAPGSVPAPHVDDHDAASNPSTPPVHTAHLGLWFDSPVDAAANGCPSAVTPFNGTHDAGIQVLNTSNFPDLKGPLLKVK